MRSIPLIGIVCVLLFAGCKSDVERRRLHTLERLDWGGGTDDQRRVRDLLSNAVASATVRSLGTPLLVDASLWIGSPEKTNGFLKVDWIAATPKADGLLVLFSDSVRIGAAFDQSGIHENERLAKEMVIFNDAVFRPDAPELWARLAPTNRLRVVLTTNGKPVSNELDVRFILR